MDILGIEYQFLKDQALVLQRLDPELKDDVGRRCTILTNKWKLLEGTLCPKKREQDQRTKSMSLILLQKSLTFQFIAKVFYYHIRKDTFTNLARLIANPPRIKFFKN